jgi:hypothetical protein
MALNHQPLRDSEWVRHAFLIPPALRGGDFGQADNRQRFKETTSADYKFTDTSLGGNFAINNPPQFTRYADVRYPGLLNRPKGLGMGRYYSEAIDDTKQVIHMSFGVPTYNSIAQFFTSFYDTRMARLANTGRSSEVFYNIGIALGYVVSLPIQPFIIGLSFVSRVLNFIQNQSPSKWYYFKPNMHSYWSAVNTIANDLAIHIGLIPRVFSEHNENGTSGTDALLKDIGGGNEYDPAVFSRLLPDIYRRDGGIDVMALALRSQRIAIKAREQMKEIRRGVTESDQLRSALIEFLNNHPDTVGHNDAMSAREYFYQAVRQESDGATATLTESTDTWSGLSLSGIAEFMRATKEAGAQFATFRVQHNGSMSESFTNSLKDSDVAQQINSKVQDARNLRFSIMDGNVFEGFEQLIGSAAQVIEGALDSVKLGGLLTLAGNAFIDVPRHWENSVANLPRAEYTIPLYSPYGNVVSRYQNLLVPIAMILAGGLPLSAGRAAYTSPFICQIYHQGRVHCQLGMIDSITINRGTGNVGWNLEHQMLGAEITFSVADLSTIMHAPIKGAFGGEGNLFVRGAQIATTLGGELIAGDQGAAVAQALTNSAVWDEGSAFNDYMSVLGGLNLNDAYYFQNRMNINATRALRSFKTWRSPSNMFLLAGDDSISRLIMQFGQGTNRFQE